MAFDLTIRQADTLPQLTATILDQTGVAFNLTGCTVQFVMRQLNAASATPTVNAAATVVSAAAGTVSYSWTATDTALPGVYQATFRVTVTSSGATYSFPNDGFMEIYVEPNITSTPTTLVSLGEAKDYLNIADSNRTHDLKLLRFLYGLQPVIEAITGPILPKVFDETYDGGQYFVELRHKPVIQLMAVSEYRGPIEYSLSLIPTTDMGQIYSAQLDGLGRVVRRSAGGGIIAFPAMPNSVHVVYQAGITPTPFNVVDGCLEMLRVNYQQTQQGRPRAGSGGASTTDGEAPDRAPIGFFVPGGVRERLTPNRRHPSLA